MPIKITVSENILITIRIKLELHMYSWNRFFISIFGGKFLLYFFLLRLIYIDCDSFSCNLNSSLHHIRPLRPGFPTSIRAAWWDMKFSKESRPWGIWTRNLRIRPSSSPYPRTTGRLSTRTDCKSFKTVLSYMYLLSIKKGFEMKV